MLKRIIFVSILLTLILSLWFDPIVLQTCEEIKIVWKDPPTEAPPYFGKVYVDGEAHELIWHDEGFLTAKINKDAKMLDWGYIIGAGPEWLGYIHQESIKCNKIRFPFVRKSG